MNLGYLVLVFAVSMVMAGVLMLIRPQYRRVAQQVIQYVSVCSLGATAIYLIQEIPVMSIALLVCGFPTFYGKHWEEKKTLPDVIPPKQSS
jgi:hypothetical protein